MRGAASLFTSRRKRLIPLVTLAVIAFEIGLYEYVAHPWGRWAPWLWVLSVPLLIGLPPAAFYWLADRRRRGEPPPA